MSWVDNTLSIDSQMLLFRAKRAEILAANLANADTPGYKARDVDFSNVLSDVRFRNVSTRTGHIAVSGGQMPQVVERAAGNDVANGNTVQREHEQSAFTQNAVQYIATLRFINGSVQSILGALRGD